MHREHEKKVVLENGEFELWLLGESRCHTFLTGSLNITDNHLCTRMLSAAANRIRIKTGVNSGDLCFLI